MSQHHSVHARGTTRHFTNTQWIKTYPWDKDNFLSYIFGIEILMTSSFNNLLYSNLFWLFSLTAVPLGGPPSNSFSPLGPLDGGSNIHLWIDLWIGFDVGSEIDNERDWKGPWRYRQPTLASTTITARVGGRRQDTCQVIDELFFGSNHLPLGGQSSVNPWFVARQG